MNQNRCRTEADSNIMPETDNQGNEDVEKLTHESYVRR